MTDNPYADGREAYDVGKSETANPHDPGSDEALSWQDGWQSGADEA